MLKKFFILFLLMYFIWGCGQMGPLYLPDQKPPIAVAKPKPVITPTTHKKTEP